MVSRFQDPFLGLEASFAGLLSLTDTGSWYSLGTPMLSYTWPLVFILDVQEQLLNEMVKVVEYSILRKRCLQDSAIKGNIE